MVKRMTTKNEPKIEGVYNAIKQKVEERKEEQNKQEITKKRKEKIVAKVLTEASPFTDIAENLVSALPVYYDKSRMWWMWNIDEYAWDLCDKTDVLNLLKYGLQLNPDMIVTQKTNLIEAIQLQARWKKPTEPKPEWIQFNDTMYNINTKEEKTVNSNYFNVNPIKWKPTENTETPVMDKLFKEWVGEEYVQTLYELIAYGCYREYPIQLLFALTGSGRNGKSQFLKVLDHFYGERNTTTSKLENLAKNYETFGIWKKLVCMMGEGNHRILNDTDVLKRLTGGDKLDFEKKYADKFNDYSYCKLIMATNALPSSEDTSEGYYRRWLIIDFPNEFPEGKPIWKTIPEEEYHALAGKILTILPELLKKGSFTNQGTVKERKERYIAKSNPLSIFIKQECEVSNMNSMILYGRLYNEYVAWLSERKLRKVSHREFNTILENEGFLKIKTSRQINGEYINGYFVQGIKLKTEFGQERGSVTDVTVVTAPSTLFPYREKSLDPSHNSHNGHTEPVPLELFSSFPSEKDILAAIRTFSEPVHFDEILALFPVENFTERFEYLKKNGQVFSPKNGYWSVLE